MQPNLKTPTPALVDAHAHICDELFDTDRAMVLERARANGVCAVVAVGAVVRMGQEVPAGHLALGIPAQVKKALDAASLAEFQEAADHYLEILPRHRRLFENG